MTAHYQFEGRRLRWLIRSSALLVVVLLATFSTSMDAQTSPAQGRQVTLRQQLRVGLKAFSKADLAFIDKVVKAVEAGSLPRKLVDSTFLWARHRAVRKSHSRRLRPMVYFQPGLTIRARRFGLKL